MVLSNFALFITDIICEQKLLYVRIKFPVTLVRDSLLFGQKDKEIQQ